MINIDFMDENCIDGVIEVENASFSIPWSKEAFMGELDSEFTVYLIASYNGKIIGYAGAWCVFGDCSITNIAVLPEYRGKGVGSMLLERLLEEASNRKAQTMILEVRKSNIHAQALYRKYGFEEISVRKGYYSDNGEDALLMERRMCQ